MWQEPHCASSNYAVVLQADNSDKQQTLSDNFKVRHPVVNINLQSNPHIEHNLSPLYK
jgi:hypothetical protein